jgi:YegS/Rv2252/BmrU family lipid kinase
VKPHVAIVLNGIALRKKFFFNKILAALHAVAHVKVYETRSAGDGIFRSKQAVEQGYPLILAAGGDGTVNQVVQGIMEYYGRMSSLPAMGIIPLGSGNDFARTLGIRTNPIRLVESLSKPQLRWVDVGRITRLSPAGLQPKYFINIADAGMGPEVVKRVLDSGRPWGSVAAYYAAILKTFFTYKPTEMEVRTPLWQWKGKARVVAVTNGKYFGNGLCIAPDAQPDDGVLHCTIVGDVSVKDFVVQNFRLRSGKRIQHPKVSYHETEWVEIYAQHAAYLEADGEWAGALPVRIDLLRKSLQVMT